MVEPHAQAISDPYVTHVPRIECPHRFDARFCFSWTRFVKDARLADAIRREKGVKDKPKENPRLERRNSVAGDSISGSPKGLK